MRRFLLLVAAVLVVSVVAFAGLEGSVELILSSDLTSASGLGGNARDDLRYRVFYQFSPGTSTGQIDAVYHDSRSIAGGSSETLDLTSLTNPLGSAVSFGHVTAMAIENTGSTTLTIGGGSSAWGSWSSVSTSTLSIPGSGTVVLLAPISGGWSVASGTGDSILIGAAAGGTGTYNIWIIGTSS